MFEETIFPELINLSNGCTVFQTLPAASASSSWCLKVLLEGKLHKFVFKFPGIWWLLWLPSNLLCSCSSPPISFLSIFSFQQSPECNLLRAGAGWISAVSILLCFSRRWESNHEKNRGVFLFSNPRRSSWWMKVHLPMTSVWLRVGELQLWGKT